MVFEVVDLLVVRKEVERPIDLLVDVDGGKEYNVHVKNDDYEELINIPVTSDLFERLRVGYKLKCGIDTVIFNDGMRDCVITEIQGFYNLNGDLKRCQLNL